MKLTISANYQNRDSDYGFLVRESSAPLSSCVACRGVLLNKAQKVWSNDDESGFGCNIVLEADSENVMVWGVRNTTPATATGEPLKFDGASDFNDANGKVVQVFERLALTPEGIFNHSEGGQVAADLAADYFMEWGELWPNEPADTTTNNGVTTEVETASL